MATIAALVAVGPSALAAENPNASKAAGFVEDAQNNDGGFAKKPNGKSDPHASLWSSLALLAAGKNPRDEFLKNARKSAEDYLVDNKDKYDSLEELGLLGMIQEGGGLGKTRFGNPIGKLRSKLTTAAVRADAGGAAIGIFALLTEGSQASQDLAASTARELLGARTSDGAWGKNGNADSAATALVLQALAKSRTATAASPQVQSALAYLKRAQANDGSIALSTEIDKGANGGAVPATAFTLQAQMALQITDPKTSGGRTVRQGLADKQLNNGGLGRDTSRFRPIGSPTVTETAQAYPAFNGKTFPLKEVKAKTGGARGRERTGAEGSDDSSERLSQGTADDGLSGSDPGAIDDPGAFAGGSADGNNLPSEDAAGSSTADKLGDAATAAAGESVSGTVVGTGPKLAAKAGASDTGLTPEDRATIALAAALALLFAFGIVVERQRVGDAGAAAGAIAAGRPVVRGASRLSGVTAMRAGKSLPPRRRWPLVALVVVGAGLIAVPVATKMMDRAPQGAAMISAFEPYMQPERIESFKRDLTEVSAYAGELDKQIPALLYPDAGTPAQQRQKMLEENSTAGIFAQQWPAADKTFDDLIARIDRNADNYQAVASLPSFKLFPWFFLIPGALLVFLGIAGLLLGNVAWLPLRRAALVVGVGLIISPILFQMYTRAPKGADMVQDFKKIENRDTVIAVQGHFSTITLGNGAIDNELRPKLRAEGLTDKQIQQQLPGMTKLSERWGQVLNNMTPMIAVMSDNVGNYAAVAALPSFTNFIWLFLLPGLLAVGLVLLAGTRAREKRSEVAATEPATSV